jgi:hypothetical protein
VSPFAGSASLFGRWKYCNLTEDWPPLAIKMDGCLPRPRPFLGAWLTGGRTSAWLFGIKQGHVDDSASVGKWCGKAALGHDLRL